MNRIALDPPTLNGTLACLEGAPREVQRIRLFISRADVRGHPRRRFATPAETPAMGAGPAQPTSFADTFERLVSL